MEKKWDPKSVSTRDYRYLQSIYFMASILGVTPFYNFEEQELLRPTLSKVYAMCLFVLLMTGRLYFFFGVVLRDFHKKGASAQILLLIDQTVFTMISVSIMIKSAVMNQQKWMEFNRNLVMFDELLRKKSKRTLKRTGFFENSYVRFVPANMLIVCGVVVPLAVIQGFIGLELITYFTYQICSYQYIFTCLYIFSITAVFRYIYDDIDDYMSEVCQVNVYPPEKRNLELRKVVSFFGVLEETIELFNDLFGWTILFVISGYVTFLLLAINRMNYFNFDNNNSVHHGTKARYGVYAAFLTINIVLLVMSCDSLKKAQRKTFLLCCNLKKRFSNNSDAKDELVTIGEYVKRDATKFSAANFFEVQRTVLFDVSCLVVTYLIVLVQFDLGTSSKDS